jgi:hypothetical protein
MFNNNYTPGKVPVNGMQLFSGNIGAIFSVRAPYTKEPAHPFDKQALLNFN